MMLLIGLLALLATAGPWQDDESSATEESGSLSRRLQDYSSTNLRVRSGPCREFRSWQIGPCVDRHNYQNNERCTIEVQNPDVRSIVMGQRRFETQLDFDYLVVNGRQFSGTMGPARLFPIDGSEILWFSDSNITANGWKVCLDDRGHPPGPGLYEMLVYTFLLTVVLGMPCSKGCALCWAGLKARPRMLELAAVGKSPDPPLCCCKCFCGGPTIYYWEGCSGNFLIACILCDCYALLCWNVSDLPKVSNEMIIVGTPVYVAAQPAFVGAAAQAQPVAVTAPEQATEKPVIVLQLDAAQPVAVTAPEQATEKPVIVLQLDAVRVVKRVPLQQPLV